MLVILTLSAAKGKDLHFMLTLPVKSFFRRTPLVFSTRRISMPLDCRF
jgi:hypothetical protein